MCQPFTRKTEWCHFPLFLQANEIMGDFFRQSYLEIKAFFSLIHHDQLKENDQLSLVAFLYFYTYLKCIRWYVYTEISHVRKGPL